jgi:UDP-4-amino-4,6-dideoxy-N-acetyl-beta-L-altrosamine transaminase
MIPYGRQDIDDDDIAAVIEVLRSDWLTQGPAIERFERRVAEYCGARHAVAVSSATAALHLACLAADLGPGDTLWTSPNTFVASANCALYCGARPDFVDIDGATLNLSVAALERRLIEARAGGGLPKVVVPVHFAGQSCAMAPIAALAQEYGFAVIEDASHAIGGRYGAAAVGACQYSDMTVFSFHPVKIITSGEGGMVLTNSTAHYERLLRLRSHGITRAPEQMRGVPDGPWYYEQIELGFNYRMTDLQAALGASQMDRIDAFVARRQQLARRYDRLLADLPLVLPRRDPEAASATHLYPVRLRLDRIAHGQRAVFDGLRQRGIGVNLHYIPVHTQPYYRDLGFMAGAFPQAEQYYREALSLPMYAALSDEQQDQVVRALREVLA